MVRNATAYLWGAVVQFHGIAKDRPNLPQKGRFRGKNIDILAKMWYIFVLFFERQGLDFA
ncbi:hypothetical protein COV06_04025 [Candidatus Uhrbacteria bacterium CG10_big_fil_rev_8_21_14_0_10_50_16]|uniref:Uncharacterized protein n=1 Tax=Candidatus Uhrbacteria bacterium CG10_big_fil_rev_8_21_14_0_10_50_16 TaxID=1975039 RepID=A0A2H0RLF3_9BACT|nr:MAG: hypothetical protein COV06_04025 [Candidatus Uhrbacteria bacterium CG10_big_fil_rev_8_21_14_0_10_50_16]